MSQLTLFDKGITPFLAQRIRRHRSVSRFDAFVVCAPASATRWRGFGDVLLLVPGLARCDALAAEGAPLIIDENCLHGGPWTGTSSPTGEGRLDELEAVAAQVRSHGGVVIGVQRDGEVPDVNLQRLRSIYELPIIPGVRGPDTSVPRVVQRVRNVLDTTPGDTHE